MSGLSENILRQSHSKSSLKEADERVKQMQLGNSNFNSAYPIQHVLNSQYHEGMFSIGQSTKHQQKASKSSMSAAVQKQAMIQKQNPPDGGA